MRNYSGSKLALFIGHQLLVYLRDEKDGLLYSGMWDLPGGGREGNETPEQCVLRELKEEFDLALDESQLTYKSHQFNQQGNRIYFFAAHVDSEPAEDIRFGDEGQYYRLVDATEFIDEVNALPHLRKQVEYYLDVLKESGHSSLT